MGETRKKAVILQDWDDVIALVGKETCDNLMDIMGGQTIYIPKNPCSSREFRNYRIYYAYNGHNVRELAYEHRLSDRQIRRIIETVGGKPKRKKAL